MAERLLDGLESARSDALRARITELTQHRSDVEVAIQDLCDRADVLGERGTLSSLDELLRLERDPVCIDRIEQAQSDLASLLASKRRPALRGEARVGESSPTSGAGTTSSASQSESRSMALAALVEARASQVRGEWKTALALAAIAEQEATTQADARLVRQSTLSSARVAAAECLTRAKDVERASGSAAARDLLQQELTRFPVAEEFDSLRFELGLMTDRAAEKNRAPAAPRVVHTGTGPAAPGMPLSANSASECAAIAMARAEQGEFALARDAWAEAGRRQQDSPWREKCEANAHECDARLALREELADFARLDEATALLMGGGGEGRAAPMFEALPLSEIATAIERARVSSKARLGWWVESVQRGNAAEVSAALAELGLALERREIDANHASHLVAKAKGESTAGGWVFQGGRWLEGAVAKSEADAAALAARAAKHAQLVGEFRRATAFERDNLLVQVRAEGDVELATRALSMRWQDDWDKLARHPNLRQLAALADERRALDSARAKALTLIFDEERYFYPYNPPECPPQKAAGYAAVQREVNELVGAVHDIWTGSKRVKVGDGLRQQLSSMSWTFSRAQEDGIDLPKPAEEFRFALALGDEAEVGLAQFAWDRNEREALTESQRIDARNERLWSALGRAKPADDVPNSSEQEQVRVTNEYRRMLGRRALAWNPKLEAAAQGHSDHMANTGDFSHFEKGDETRRTPFDRMKLAGYPLGISENLSMGRSDPKSAHEGWTQSSGHHRNLLMRDHREMASAIASNYWTQNFGVDSAFQADL